MITISAQHEINELKRDNNELKRENRKLRLRQEYRDSQVAKLKKHNKELKLVIGKLLA